MDMWRETGYCVVVKPRRCVMTQKADILRIISIPEGYGAAERTGGCLCRGLL